VNGDNGYIAMQVSGLEVLPGAGLTDSGRSKLHSFLMSRRFLSFKDVLVLLH